MNYKEKKILVVGLGLSGRSAAEFLLKQEAKVVGIDKNYAQLKDNPEIIELIASGLAVDSDQDISIEAFDLIIMSPGIPQTHPVYASALLQNKTIWGEIELGCRSVHNPIIGITGTNGKTTVTLLVTHVLNESGKKARALGNVGTPLTKEILSIQPDEILVLELSSYQLETLSQRVLDTGVILNITPDHLDRYKSMEAYAKAKIQMQNCLKEGHPLYIEESVCKDFGPLIKTPYLRKYGYSPLSDIYTDLTHVYISKENVFELPKFYQGKPNHDTENIMAAFALCMHFGVTSNQFLNALKTFKKPSHRIEFIQERDGIFYYDDSKGTNIDAVIRAVQFVNGKIILIAGGVDKGSAYTPWIEAFTNRVKCICAIGQSASKMHDQLSHRIPVYIFSTLEDAIRHAETLAVSGDNILLSPGCSSFDMFRDYAHRGQEFQRIVKREK